MCGLVGILRTGSAKGPIESTLLAAMRDTMAHRGPDDAGLYISPDQKIGLGFRRLSIIDLSSQASQPMSNADGSIWIVFNGEIYNHAEIRPQLEAAGLKFKTDHSDTEVILKGYEAWGEDILPKLRGMFAFVIWDSRKKKLWCVRDRMGVKPLYYTLHNGMFLFASEIKAILAYPGVPRKVHERAFYDFLTFLVSPAPQTLFDGIYKLPASHTLTIYEDGHQEMKRYWNPFYDLKGYPDRTEEDWTGEIVSKLKESIKYRMVSDVKFGVFLSGGIDSSTNVALMAEQMDRPVETFSIGFKDGEKFNELNYARMIRDRFKTNHHEIMIGPDDLIQFLPKLIFHQDEPIVDPVCVPVYYVSKLARDNNTIVCQVGEGADELFCGYPSWIDSLKFQQYNRYYQHIPSALRRMLWKCMDPFIQGNLAARGKLEFLRRASQDEQLFWGGADAYYEIQKKRFLSDKFLGRLDGYTSYEPLQSLYNDFKNDAPENPDPLHWMTYLDLRLRLPELLLMRVDKMTMATSVESRVPFLDQEFVRLAMSIPQSARIKNNIPKYLLKKAIEPILPHEIVYRKKQGFGVPVEDWFKDRLKGWANKKILDFVRRTDYFKPEVMEKFVLKSGGGSLWFLLNFVLWHEIWIENKELDLPL